MRTSSNGNAVKNIFELKSARRLLVEGNIFENCWLAAQGGWALQFTVRNQDGAAPWSTIEDVTFENVQAWSRKFLLFAIASQERAIDLGTGDLSEAALGWSTYGADHMSHYAINAGGDLRLFGDHVEAVHVRDPRARGSPAAGRPPVP